MLKVDNQTVANYARERRWEKRGNKFVFRSESSEKEEGGVPSLELAKMAISYAREMEQIV